MFYLYLLASTRLYVSTKLLFVSIT